MTFDSYSPVEGALELSNQQGSPKSTGKLCSVNCDDANEDCEILLTYFPYKNDR